MKKVIVTGVTGQDGSYMVDYLLANTKHKIYGGVRRLSVKNHDNIEHLMGNERFELIDLDVTDSVNVSGVICNIRPDYFINFAANSFVGSSWDMPINHFQTNTMAVLYQLEAIRQFARHCRYYNAGSSEEFGDVSYSPQDEYHPLRPRSPYGASKASARHITKVYRESYGLYAVQGWLFNHESERRGEEFVTRKITKGVNRIKKELTNKDKVTPIFIGNVDAKRDWSHAEDFVDGVWRMLNQEEHREELAKIKYSGDSILFPSSVEARANKTLSSEIKEYVLSSGETHSVKDFIDEAFRHAGINGEWVGEEEEAIFTYDGRILVEVDPKFFRPAEVNLLLGNSDRARSELGWSPKTFFSGLVARMMAVDEI